LAPDGGLYMPAVWPEMRDWRSFEGAPLSRIAAEVLHAFAPDDLPLVEAEGITHAAFATFSHDGVTPLRRIGDDWLLELFHGPTLAFKDVALQTIARLFERQLQNQGGRLNVVVATSGDTGGAAVAAIAGRDNQSITALYPHGRISEVQRRFMTTNGAPNVHNLAIEGTFDDCQRIVKELFADQAFAREVALGGVNSINWGRIAVQASYYIKACLDLGGNGAGFSVPTGNFGDVFAGYVARKLGAPVGRLMVAVNDNDILDRTLRTGIYRRRGITPTHSPSMDIEVASNFERLLFEASNRDAGTVARLMAQLSDEGGFAVPDQILHAIRTDFSSVTASGEQVAAIMAEVFKAEGELIDPHTAVGLFGARRLRRECPSASVVTLATAHPAKFPEAVNAATGQWPPLPQGLEIMKKTESFAVLPPDTEAVKSFMRERAGLDSH
jgi:threonine synthase